MSLSPESIPWSFALTYDADIAEPYHVRLTYGGEILERSGRTATDAVQGLLKIAEYIEDPDLRRRCRAAIRRGLGRESEP